MLTSRRCGPTMPLSPRPSTRRGTERWRDINPSTAPVSLGLGPPALNQPRAENAMSQQDNIQIVRHIFEAWNKHDVERYGKLLDEKHVVESDTRSPTCISISTRSSGRATTSRPAGRRPARIEGN